MKSCSTLVSFVSREASRKLLCEKNIKLIVIRNFSNAINQLTLEQAASKQIAESRKTKMENSCGKIFSLSDYDCVGFDLDNTIVKYNVKNMIYHEYDVLSRFLTARGYSKEYLLKPIDEGADFMQKGLVLDFERGNLLRTCPDGSIQIASHGTTFLTDQEVVDIYGEKKRWEVTDEYCKDMLVAWNGSMSEQIRTCLDYFDMPAALAFARIIDSIDEEKGGRQQKYKVWPDILDGLMALYTRELFDTKESEYFEGIKNNPAKFIHKCDQATLDWLKTLKAEKKTFLVTGSHIDFASLTAGYAMGPHWREFFDVVICYSKKPGFFTMRRPFLQLDGIKETSPIAVSDMKQGTVYTQGNFEDLKAFISSLGPEKELKVVYVGDNLIQDVFTPNKHKNVDTIAIVEEMWAEGVDYDPKFEVLRSNVWGSYFHTNGNDTLWENIIRKHAKICVPSVDVLARNPISHKYAAFDSRNPSSCGYHPHDPFDVVQK